MNKKLIEKAIDVLIPKAGGASYPVANASIAIELLKQAIAPEPLFYFNQLVLVSNDGNCWFRAILKGLEPDFNGEYSALSETTGVVRWKYCKPDLGAVSLPNWLPTIDGSTPPGVFSSDTETVHFSKDKTMYCVIPEPVYLEVSDD